MRKFASRRIGEAMPDEAASACIQPWTPVAAHLHMPNFVTQNWYVGQAKRAVKEA